MREAWKFVFCLSTLLKLNEGGPKYCFMFNMLIVLDEGGIIFCWRERLALLFIDSDMHDQMSEPLNLLLSLKEHGKRFA